MIWFKTTAVLCILLMQATQVAADNFAQSIVSPEKTVGYSLGDVIEQRVSLEQLDTATALEQLPLLQREGPWLERVSATVSKDTDWLIVRYQIVNAPTEVVVTTLPALNIANDQDTVLSVDDWYFSISPNLPPNGADTATLPVMQPDTQPNAVATAPLLHRLKLLSGILTMVLIGWLLWWQWQNWSDSRNLPFARAYKTIRRFDSATVNQQAEAWVTMHRAFNQTADRTISSGTLAQFLQAAPWLKSLENPVAEFFSASTQRFFDTTDIDTKNIKDSFDLVAFSKKLHKAEKRFHSGIGMQQGTVSQS